MEREDSAQRIRILVVEDEGITAMDAADQLNGLGYAVTGSVFSAAEAVRRVAEERPDLVLMDIRLKGNVDGIAAAQEIRAKFDVPIVYATAYADEATLQRAKLTEPFGYILKPYDQRELRTTIEMALYRHQVERQRADFLAMLSHDIRNPLGVILAYTEMLGEEVRGGNLGEAEDLIERLTSTTLSVHSLVTNYLEASRIESGRLASRREPVQLNDLLTRVAEQYEAEARRRRVRLVVSLRESLPTVGADALDVERIVANLVYNALKFTPANGCVTLTSAEQGEDAVVTISDTGTGIPSESMPHLFDRYQKSVVPRVGGGTGLGLFIVKTLVEAHGGRIEVESSSERGACFRVFLPIAAAAAVEADIAGARHP